ncbi:MAG: N-acetylmannosamine-6-phosphate 2-epimerase [Christensenellaceae bacterium]|nr:N-acetylmannosamine-6-phosphate 2-epimerase [Christensenellaceae bacterium]
MKDLSVLDNLRGKLIVSCQALETEPLYDPDRSLMGHMAKAAYLGGASGIRANTVRDIIEIKKFVDLPIIGIIKAETPGCSVFITPTIKEIDDLVAIGCDIIATDATDRIRPDGKTLDEFFTECKKKYPNQLFMADCSTYEECMHAEEIGFDVVSTTLTGYTEKTKGVEIPNFELISRIVKDCKAYIIAEGGIWKPEQLAEAYKTGVDSVVIGSAITRPMEITKRFAAVLNK